MRKNVETDGQLYQELWTLEKEHRAMRLESSFCDNPSSQEQGRQVSIDSEEEANLPSKYARASPLD
jgi:hypothetical protein